ncbi:hypothetical protein EXN57_02125 [Clostridium botulinum]|nr:hypothetical protein [Clostridium botulinum]NFD33742.1 hypothetical protein [Clostridium botulinum]NFD57841.1 hypothetical protein [Clostridium botulinum]NFE00140.1 hypothetical protein [Clostridium botulinum]
MWIRNQDKSVLGTLNVIQVNKNIIYGNIGGSENGILGEYETEERALEVLDMIEDRIMQGTKFDEIQNGKRKTRDFVFQMPAK